MYRQCRAVKLPTRGSHSLTPLLMVAAVSLQHICLQLLSIFRFVVLILAYALLRSAKPWFVAVSILNSFVSCFVARSNTSVVVAPVYHRTMDDAPILTFVLHMVA